jgi:hypothetical protein
MRQRKTTQAWSGPANSHRPTRVLIESADPALAVSDFAAFRAAGMDVALCQGPEHTPAECPVVRGEPCQLAAGADVILFDLGPSGQRVLEAERRLHPETPVVVRGAAPGAVPEGCGQLSVNASVDGQISVLRRAADQG